MNGLLCTFRRTAVSSDLDLHKRRVETSNVSTNGPVESRRSFELIGPDKRRCGHENFRIVGKPAVIGLSLRLIPVNAKLKRAAFAQAGAKHAWSIEAPHQLSVGRQRDYTAIAVDCH